MTRSPWAREYARTPNEYIWGLAPSDFARAVRALLSPGARVLELGCGEGRDSVYFAACGCDVTGVDVSVAGLHKAQRLARAHGVKVHWVHGDAAHDLPAGPHRPTECHIMQAMWTPGRHPASSWRGTVHHEGASAFPLALIRAADGGITRRKSP